MVSKKFYRIVIYSNNVIKGDCADGWYLINVGDVTLDDTKQYQYSIDKFNFYASGLPTASFMIDIPQFASGNSYSSLTQTINGTNFIVNGNQYVKTHSEFDTIGNPIGSINIIRGGMINIKVLDLTGNKLNSFVTNGVKWIMHMIIWEVPKHARKI